MIVCKDCERVVAINDDGLDQMEKLESHRLWYHPSEQDIEDCFYAMLDTLARMPIFKADENWTQLEIQAAALENLSLRYHKYMTTKRDQLHGKHF